jgi:hypothetical protein
MKRSRVIGTGTFGCGTVIVEGDDFIAENITFENSAPQVLLVHLFSLHKEMIRQWLWKADVFCCDAGIWASGRCTCNSR